MLVLLFQLVTLPVEYDASGRAKQLVVASGIIQPEQRRGMDQVLDAAALTYVAAGASSVSLVMSYLFRAGTLGGGRDD